MHITALAIDAVAVGRLEKRRIGAMDARSAPGSRVARGCHCILHRADTPPLTLPDPGSMRCRAGVSMKKGRYEAEVSMSLVSGHFPSWALCVPHTVRVARP